MSALDEPGVLAEVRAAVAVVLEVDPAAITAETRFVVDLDADSLAMVELVEIVEERLSGRLPGGLRIPDADVETFDSVADVVGYVLARARGGRP